jgi:Tol biopolymer transport system component
MRAVDAVGADRGFAEDRPKQWRKVPMRSPVILARLMVFVAAVTVMIRASTAADAASTPKTRPAEQTVVFSSNRSGSWAIWAIRPDGSQLRQISKPASGEQDVDPAFSPDGSGILFTSTRGGTAGLWQMARDGGDARRICDGDQGGWSPDGRKIVLRRSGKLLTREVATGKEKVISPEGWEKCSGASWSPDGANIAFACLGTGGNAIYLLAADGGGSPTKVYDKQGACQPRWSPGGKVIVYETETHLCTINPDGTKNRLITFYGGVQRYGRFSPDGTRLVFCQAAAPDGPWELYTVAATGGTPTKLTEGSSDMYPDWK